MIYNVYPKDVPLLKRRKICGRDRQAADGNITQRMRFAR